VQVHQEAGLDCPRDGCGGRIAESCPSCGRQYVLEKVTKKDGTTRFCDSEGCGFKKAVNS
jgi:hypothetical protein